MALWMIKALFVAFVVIFVMALFEKNWSLAMYWAGASIIQISIIMMHG